MARSFRSAGAVLALSALFALTGCPSDPYDPQTWIGKLEDPHEVDRAVTELERLHCPEAIEPLGNAWRKHNKDSKILRVIIAIADQPAAKKGENRDCPDAGDGPYWGDAVPVLVEAVEEFDIGDRREIEDAVVAADALGKAKDPEAVQTLISAATKKMPKLSEGQRVRIAAIRALGSYGNNPRAVDTLIKILGTSPEEQPVHLNAAAADALAGTKSEKAIQPLLVALFEVSPIYPQVRQALSRVGEPAIPELLKIFKGEHKAINQIADKHDFAKNCDTKQGPGTTCKAPGNLTFKSAALLGDLRANKAVPALVAQLKKPSKVSFFDPKTGAPGPADHNAVLDALRNIGATSSDDAVHAYMVDPQTDDQIRPLAIDTYSMLTRDTKALDWLAGQFQDADQEEQIRAASAMAYARLVRSDKQLRPIQKIIDMQLDKAKEFDAKAKRAKKEEDKANAEATAADYRAFAREYEQHRTRARVGIVCGDKAECYAEFLTLDANQIAEKLKIPNHRSGEMTRQDKAAYRLAALERALLEIAKLGDKAKGALEPLLANADSTERIIRQGVLLALVQVAPKPCEACVTRLEEVIAKQKDQTTLDHLTDETEIVRSYFLRTAGK